MSRLPYRWRVLRGSRLRERALPGSDLRAEADRRFLHGSGSVRFGKLRGRGLLQWRVHRPLQRLQCPGLGGDVREHSRGTGSRQ